MATNDANRSNEPAPGAPKPEIDRTAIRHLLTLTPEERIRTAAVEARNLRLFDLAIEASKKR